MEDKAPLTDITIPIEMATDALSLEEIGALLVVMTLPHNPKSPEWGKNEKFLKMINHLIDEGIIVPSKVDGKLDMDIDLTWL